MAELSEEQQALHCSPCTLGTLDLDDRLHLDVVHPYRETVDLAIREVATRDNFLTETTSNGHSNSKGCRLNKAVIKVCLSTAFPCPRHCPFCAAPPKHCLSMP